MSLPDTCFFPLFAVLMLRPSVTRERRFRPLYGVACNNAGSHENICRLREADVRSPSANQGSISATMARQGQSTRRIRLRLIWRGPKRRRPARRRLQQEMRPRSEFAGLAHLQRTSDLLRRSVIPASKRVAKIRRFAEAQGMGDIIDRHLSIAQILYRHLGS